MSDPKPAKFYQFPQALLAAGRDEREKLNLIVAYGTIHAGMGLEAKMEYGADTIAENRAGGCKDFDPENELHRAWALGKDMVTLSWHQSPVHCVAWYEQGQKFLKRFGKTPFVRVMGDLVSDVTKGAFDFRDFAVLTAVYAVIGDKQYAIVRRHRVRAGALGYASASKLFDEGGTLTPAGKQTLLAREDGWQPLTLNQVRGSLDKLHGRKFFSRIQPIQCGRSVYYSRSLSHTELADHLFKRMEKKASADLDQQSAEQTLRKKRDALLKRCFPVNSPQTTTQAPRKAPQHPPQGAPHEAPL